MRQIVSFKKLTALIFALVAFGLLAESAYSFSYSAATKTARMTAVRDRIDAGSGPGKIQVGTAGMGVVCLEYTLENPSGFVTGSTLMLSGFPMTTIATATCSPVAAARVLNSDNEVVIDNLTVGLSGTNVIIDSLIVNAGQLVTASASPTFTHGG